MKININYVSRKWYNKTTINSWFWYYKPYVNIIGFNTRICGVHFNIKENNATQKLINKSKTVIH